MTEYVVENDYKTFKNHKRVGQIISSDYDHHMLQYHVIWISYCKSTYFGNGEKGKVYEEGIRLGIWSKVNWFGLIKYMSES